MTVPEHSSDEPVADPRWRKSWQERVAPGAPRKASSSTRYNRSTSSKGMFRPVLTGQAWTDIYLRSGSPPLYASVIAPLIVLGVTKDGR